MTPPDIISNIEVFPIRPHNGHIDFVSWIITISDDVKFSVSNVAVYTRWRGGVRLVYPCKSLPSGKQVPSFCPITPKAGDLLERAVVDKLEALMRKHDKDVTAIAQPRGDADVIDSRVPGHALS